MCTTVCNDSCVYGCVHGFVQAGVCGAHHEVCEVDRAVEQVVGPAVDVDMDVVPAGVGRVRADHVEHEHDRLLRISKPPRVNIPW